MIFLSFQNLKKSSEFNLCIAYLNNAISQPSKLKLVLTILINVSISKCSAKGSQFYKQAFGISEIELCRGL